MIKTNCWVDGGCKQSTGLSGIGVLIKSVEDNKILVEEYRGIGKATNNIAEYKALILGLQYLYTIKSDYAKIHTDSKLVYSQLTCKKCLKQRCDCNVGTLYSVKNRGLKSLNIEAKGLLDLLQTSIKNVDIVHIGREYNEEADALATLGIEYGNRIK